MSPEELQQKKATIRNSSYITAGAGRVYLSKQASVRERLSDYLAAATPAERLKILNEKHASAVADLSQRIEAVRAGLATLENARERRAWRFVSGSNWRLWSVARHDGLTAAVGDREPSHPVSTNQV